MIYTFLCTFAFGLRQLFPRHIRKRKKRYAYLEVGNVGNSRLFRGKSVIGFSRYSVGCYYYIRVYRFPTTSNSERGICSSTLLRN